MKRLILVTTVIWFCSGLFSGVEGQRRNKRLPPQKTGTSKPPEQKKDKDVIWIHSVPSGLDVYLAPDTESSPSEQKPDDAGWTTVVENHPVIDKRFLKGKTPVLIHNVSPGKYLLGIAPVKLLDKQGPCDCDATLKAKVFVSFVPLTSDLFDNVRSGRIVVKGAVVYSITKEVVDPQRVVVLAIPQDTVIDALDPFYPPNPSFSFDEVLLAKELTEASHNVLPEGEIQKTVSLLRRGGKVILTKGDVRFLIEILSDGKWAIKLQARVPKQ